MAFVLLIHNVGLELNTLTEPTITQYKSITVESGDTLSTIANRYNYTNEDIDNIVKEIKTFNKLKSNKIYAGEDLIVPVKIYKTSVAQK
jgi:LysM repeat protein